MVRSGGAKQGSGDRDSVNRIEVVVHYLSRQFFSMDSRFYRLLQERKKGSQGVQKNSSGL